MPPQLQQVHAFLNRLTAWAAGAPEILAVALCGSHARNEATETSDIDLIVIARHPQIYLQQTTWAQEFGAIDHQQLEPYGRLTFLRVWYSLVLRWNTGLAMKCGPRLPWMKAPSGWSLTGYEFSLSADRY